MNMTMMMGGNNNNQLSSVQTNEGCVSSGSNDGGEGNGVTLKKGPWAAAEDAVLAEYVRSHGEGNWNAVQKNTGLARCGKSCRLRWANHLRSNLKKGAFSPDEERIIIELHAKMGNKWARMATQLPGRTDNEIKNYWNTRVKKRQRQGLPLYPPEIQPLYSQHQHHRRHRHSQPKTPTPPPPPTTTTTTTSNSCFSFQTPIMSLHTSMSSPLHPLHIPQIPHAQNFFYDPHSTATPPLPGPNSVSTLSPLPSPSGCSTPLPNNMSPLHSPHQPPAFPTLPLFDTTVAVAAHSNNGYFHNSHKRFKQDGSHHQSYNNSKNNNSLMFSHVPVQQHYYSNRTSTLHHHHPNMDFGLFYPLKTEIHSNFNDDGLLENMLEEAQVMASANNKEMQKQEQEDQEDYSRLINDNGPSSMGMAINDWCNDSGESSDRKHSVITDNDQNHIALDMHHLASLFPVDILTNHDAGSLSGQSWENFRF